MTKQNGQGKGKENFFTHFNGQFTKKKLFD